MKKWGLISLAAFTILLWAAVIGFYVHTPKPTQLAETHSSSLEPSHYDKSITDDQIASHFLNDTTGGAIHENKAETIFGEQVITQNWVNDVSEDGKLSIDTVLDSLNLNEDTADNS
ncbi:hypothetical protein [Halobacillus salinus]|uniref:Uncharacterized protein n=1 Tax=Halobacillus salinus TaxID=192814 RepID=A0A4Z0H0W3_9BACI|nr:hypothetical protein [Halobacillus salinus]TGB04048.1 hypothetical protein E4663_03300 [Halobacillus salinus]